MDLTSQVGALNVFRAKLGIGQKKKLEGVIKVEVTPGSAAHSSMTSSSASANKVPGRKDTEETRKTEETTPRRSTRTVGTPSKDVGIGSGSSGQKTVVKKSLYEPLVVTGGGAVAGDQPRTSVRNLRSGNNSGNKSGNKSGSQKRRKI